MVAHVEAALEARAAVLYEENARYLAELERITPLHTAVITELSGMKTKGNQIDALFDSSISALDTWAETHANLRVAVKAAGFLTRDSRVVERKKYGRAKARRSFQFSKR